MCIFLLVATYAIVQFDTDISHSFVLATFAKTRNRKIEISNEEWHVHISIGETKETNQVYKRCKLKISNWQLSTDMIVIKMTNFDAIFGMD